MEVGELMGMLDTKHRQVLDARQQSRRMEKMFSWYKRRTSGVQHLKAAIRAVQANQAVQQAHGAGHCTYHIPRVALVIPNTARIRGINALPP